MAMNLCHRLCCNSNRWAKGFHDVEVKIGTGRQRWRAVKAA